MKVYTIKDKPYLGVKSDDNLRLFIYDIATLEQFVPIAINDHKITLGFASYDAMQGVLDLDVMLVNQRNNIKLVKGDDLTSVPTADIWKAYRPLTFACVELLIAELLNGTDIVHKNHSAKWDEDRYEFITSTEWSTMPLEGWYA